MFNENWPRWLVASVNKHFSQLEDEDIKVFYEGQVRQTADWDDFVEVRVDGPYWRQTTRNNYIVRIEVNILIQHSISPAKNLYTITTINGKVGRCMSTIPVYKLGSETGDDGTQIGCLELVSNPASRDWTRHNEFGQIETKTSLRQESVEGHFQIELTGV